MAGFSSASRRIFIIRPGACPKRETTVAWSGSDERIMFSGLYVCLLDGSGPLGWPREFIKWKINRYNQIQPTYIFIYSLMTTMLLLL